MEAVLDRAPGADIRASTQPPRAARAAVTALFFVNGILFASWVSRIPAVQAERGLGDGWLGLALLGLALGAMTAMPLAGWLSARMGSRRVTGMFALLYCAMLPALVWAPNGWLFVPALLLFGAAHGGTDVAMNAQAVAVEKHYPGSIMSSFHALFSAGGLAGALLGGLLAANGLSPETHFSLMAMATATTVLLASPFLLRADGGSSAASPERAAHLFRPGRMLLVLGAVAFCILMGEGAMADWSAIYLKRILETSEGTAAIGYAAFSIAMMAGRFSGDALAARFGAVRLVRGGGLLAAAGMALVLLSAHPGMALAGFALVGAGFATVVPMVFSAAGRAPHVSPGMALATVTTMGYCGFLAGPPLIGFAAEFLGLRASLGIIVATTLLTAGLAPAVKRAE